MRADAHRLIGGEVALAASLPHLTQNPSWESAAATVLLCVAGCGLGDLPDIDTHIGQPHRGWTHAWSVAALVGLVLSQIVALRWPELSWTVFWACSGAMASHGLVDLVNTTGVALFWPIPGRIRGPLARWGWVLESSDTEKTVERYVQLAVPPLLLVGWPMWLWPHLHHILAAR